MIGKTESNLRDNPDYDKDWDAKTALLNQKMPADVNYRIPAEEEHKIKVNSQRRQMLELLRWRRTRAMNNVINLDVLIMRCEQSPQFLDALVQARDLMQEHGNSGSVIG